MNIKEKLITFKDKAKTNKGEDEIEVKDAVEANHIIATIQPKTTDDYLKLFSAFNLLNSYVKKSYAPKEFRKNYNFKHKVMISVENLIIENPKNVKVTGSYRLIFVKIYNIQFSFHNIGYSALIAKKSCEWERDVWEKVRYQPVALSLFNLVNNRVQKNANSVENQTEENLIF